MKLERLVINNFRSYEHAAVSFSPSQNYIFGKNWQGKSSIVDAIGYALFGKRTFPLRIAGSSVKAEHIVREGATEGFVELHFEHDEKSYVIKRTCPRESVTLECNGRKVGESSTTVSEYLAELLGVDKELFANVFYSEQDALRRVLEVTPEERKVFVEAILGFDYLKEVKMSAKHAADSLRKWLDGFTSGNVKTILDMCKQLQRRVDEISRRITMLAESISKYKDAPKLTSEALSRATKATGKLETALEELSAVKTQKNFHNHLLKGISTGICPTCKQSITGSAKTHAEHELKHIIEEIEKKIGEADLEFKKFERELAKANSDMFQSQANETILSGYTSERNTLEEELEEDKKQLGELKKQIAAYENKDQVIKRINDETAFLEELQSAIDEFRTNLRQLMVSDLENAANFLLAKFSDGDFDAQLKITDEFGFQILLHNRPVPIFNLSGAARDILAISIRYGLYRIASKEINFLLLDEPTHHFDQSNTAKFKQALNELSDQQLIVITVHDEELSDKERRRRRLRRELREKAEKTLGKGGRKVDKGFQDAFGGQEHAEKYLRRHKFKYAAEPKDKVPEVKPTSVSGEPWTEPSRWIPPTPTEEYPRKGAAADLQILGKQNIEYDRREQPHSENQDDIRKADALVHDDLTVEKTKDDNSTQNIATVEIETPLDTAHDITSQIATRMEDAGYRHLSTEFEQPDAEELARIEVEARKDYAPSEEQIAEFVEAVQDPAKVDQLLTPEDSISPLELSEQHEKIRRKAIGDILEEERQGLMQDFELTPENAPMEEEPY